MMYNRVRFPVAALCRKRRIESGNRMFSRFNGSDADSTGNSVLRQLGTGDNVHFILYARERIVNLCVSVNPWDASFRRSEPITRLTPLQEAGILYSEGRDEVRQDVSP